MDLTKLLAICIVATALILIVNPHRSDYAVLISLASGAVLLVMTIAKIFPAIESFKERFYWNETAEECLLIAVKALGISYLSGFVADTCRDFGQSAMASRAEFAGKCAIFLLTLPLLYRIIELSVQIAKL
ncbi:MAG: hypothetical protein IKI29_06195 [Clostridia bacterium]|nr:hypothetical protein [Clostridia bacterium]